MPPGQEHNFSSLSDGGLDNIVISILLVTPQSGVGLVQGALRLKGLRIQRCRVIEALRRLDPVMSVLRQSQRIIRCTYGMYLHKLRFVTTKVHCLNLTKLRPFQLEIG